MTAPPAWPLGRQHPTRGTRHAWRGSWGPMSDRRSKLSRLAACIRRELVAQYPPRTPLDHRRIGRAARLMALAEATGSSLGADPKATPRRLVSLEAAADRALLPLEAHRNGHGPLDLARRLAKAAGERSR
jgi:hypothetical protein